MDPSGQHPTGCLASEYFAMVETGLLAPDDKVELLHGLIVSMSPQQPRHAATVWWISGKLAALVGERAIVRSQLPFVASTTSVPEPDVAVVPFRFDGYQRAHPERALLVVEVADSSAAQDRLTKSSIYARAQVPDYWIVNLRDQCVEWFHDADVASGAYRRSGIAAGEQRLPATPLDWILRAIDLFPPR